ncbi:hypothetical protein Peur_003220 [Populus x canadensis]
MDSKPRLLLLLFLPFSSARACHAYVAKKTPVSSTWVPDLSTNQKTSSPKNPYSRSSSSRDGDNQEWLLVHSRNCVWGLHCSELRCTQHQEACHHWTFHG